MVSNAISKASGAKSFMAGFVRIVILALVLAMGLRSMGIANDIFNKLRVRKSIHLHQFKDGIL